MFYFELKSDAVMQYVEKCVKLRQKIKPLRTCVSIFFYFSKK